MTILYHKAVKIFISMVGLASVQLLLICSVAFSQSVSGTVVDSQTEEAMPGVNVSVKGTTTGIATDAEGTYSLKVPSLQDTLVISFVGYQTQEVPINGRSEVNVALQQEAISGEELVVVGYGTQRSEELSGSVSSVSSTEIQDIPVTGADQKLSGQMAGVQVSQVTGSPGGGTVIRIRGSGSIAAGYDPLFVIDGFPVSNDYNHSVYPLANINPADIESMTVLKDASATAIYGSRGSNGVILIETKQAQAGVTEVELSTYTGWQRMPQKGRPDMMTAEEFDQWRIE